MSKRKIFAKIDSVTSTKYYKQRPNNVITSGSEEIPPQSKIIEYGPRLDGGTRRFDFSPWYGVGIDSITHALQRQIELYLKNENDQLSTKTIESYCSIGVRSFLRYLATLSSALNRSLTLADIHRQTIDGYVRALKDDLRVSDTTRRSRYNSIKAVLKSLCHRGVISESLGGDDTTFPFNPFPNAYRTSKGESPLSKAERQEFSAAVKTAVMPIFSDDVEPTSELLAYALLVIALHTGRNTTPLLEMTTNCLRPHPKDDLLFLVLYKRRGHSTSKVAIRADFDHTETESMRAIKPTVARLIQRVIELSQRLRQEAPKHLADRVWLYRRQMKGRGVVAAGEVTVLNEGTLERAINLLVKRHQLFSPDGRPLRINISRLRKTFVNRIYEILDGDVTSTAAAAGDSVRVTDVNYLRPSENAKRNWRFLGQTLVQELLSDTVGATELTPLGRCTDNENGEYAPKRNGALCMNFTDCLRCRNYVVTADDLYRLFSFYWRVLKERAVMQPKRWHRQFGHIIRLIERDVIEAGLSKKIFKQAEVSRERERARVSPHPFWRCDTILSDLAEGLI